MIYQKLRQRELAINHKRIERLYRMATPTVSEVDGKPVRVQRSSMVVFLTLTTISYIITLKTMKTPDSKTRKALSGNWSLKYHRENGKQ